MRPLFLAAFAFASPAAAADRTFPTGSFERVRVEGPFQVRILTGGAPRASASADRPTLDRLSVEVNGGTLTVRMGGAGWAELPRLAKATVPVVSLATPRLASVAISGGAQVETGALRGPRVDLTVTGPGTLTVARVEADQLVATVVGSGTLSLAGKAVNARLSVNGTGAIAAPALVADTAVVRLEGSGEVTAEARYAAQVTSTGLGRVTVAGTAQCTVRAPAGGPVACGGAK